MSKKQQRSKRRKATPAKGKGQRQSVRPSGKGVSGRPSRRKIRRRIHLGVGAAVALVLAGSLWWLSSARQSDFLALADAGRDELSAQVVHEPSKGRDHVSGAVNYDQRFPTSGPHNPTWVDPGVYDERQPTAKLVHALEHGNIVIYYDDPAGRVMDQLRAWAGLYDNQWSGIVLAPARGLDDTILLTAWTQRLQLESFNPELAAAFIDAYRGRGPENPVR